MQDGLVKFRIVAETVAWLAVIVVCTLFGLKLTRDVFRPQPVPLVRDQLDYQKGDKAPALPGINYNHPTTIVVAVSSNCRFCIESAPFYRELAAASRRGSDSRVVFVFPQSGDAVSEYLNQGKLSGLIQLGSDALTDVPLNKLQIRATPTILTVDKTGNVRKVFVGKLSREQERQLLADL